MFKSLVSLAVFTFITLASLSFADCSPATCCQSVQMGLGWRRDSLDWKLHGLDNSYVDANVSSHIDFKNIDMYTAHAKAKWVGSEFYIRLSAEYGLSDKGRAKERFRLDSCLVDGAVFVETNDRIKRRSEFYDFSGAVGYPLAFCNCRLSVVPLIGFSFHRQRIRVKADEHYSSSYYACSEYTSMPSSYSGSAFFVESYNPFGFSSYSNPFSSPSDPQIASALGLSTARRTSSYRFTWYGFFTGVDVAYALDPCWTIFTELEAHFLNNCHRKRRSWTGVYFVDDYHHKGWAYGFNTSFGTAFSMSNCWYGVLTVDFKWWKGHSNHDELYWKSVGAKAALAYEF